MPAFFFEKKTRESQRQIPDYKFKIPEPETDSKFRLRITERLIYNRTRMIEIPKTYDPKEAEHHHYERWEERGYFAPEINEDPLAPRLFDRHSAAERDRLAAHGPRAAAHDDGRADALQTDARLIARLWLPGMDHAGISTQLMVTRELKKEGLTRHDLGREKFVERVWKWKEEYGGQILNQMRREGASVDWSRDQVHDGRRSFARGARSLRAAVRRRNDLSRQPHRQLVSERSDGAFGSGSAEASRRKESSTTCTIRSRTGKAPITVATTRPETMLGDTAVAVNPNDERYRDLIGETLMLPLVNREIPVVADEFVESEFGTGAVKVTPAHDPNDYEMGVRHDLEQVERDRSLRAR